MKKFSWVFSLVVMMLLLSGWTNFDKLTNDRTKSKIRKVNLVISAVISSDYVQQFHEYLDYALGDWQVIQKETKGYSSGGVLTKYFWKVGYTSTNNQERIFYFDNFNKDKSPSECFGSWVMYNAQGIVGHQIKEEIVGKYFAADELGVSEYEKNASKTSAFIIMDDLLPEEKELAYYREISRPGTGIKLKDVTVHSLLATNPNYAIEFYINTDVTDSAGMARVKELRDKVAKDLVQCCGNNGIIIAQINWNKLPRKDSYQEDVRYFAFGKEIPDDIEKRRELHRTPSGYIAAAVKFNKIKIKGLNS